MRKIVSVIAVLMAISVSILCAIGYIYSDE